jgi:mannose-1-phosphate guanylyltransferase
VKAVIIAGGFGTRLRPLSCTRPKHLFPIGGKPLLDWTLERLAKHEVDEAILAVNYLAEAFVKHYGKTACGMKVSYCTEPQPLGTGGCIKNAETMIGHDEPFLLLNGDVLSETDYTKLVTEHQRNGGMATIALHRVRDPSRYGVVELAGRNRIRRFVEKPGRKKAPSNLINAGVYVLSPGIFEYISSGRRVSIEREVFPALARDGRLFGYRFDGQWVDVGEPSDFLRGNRLLLDSEFPSGNIAESSSIDERARITKPSAIGKRVKVGARSRIGPHVSLSEEVMVGENVRIRNSVVFPRAIISDFASIEGAIIGEGALIGKEAVIESNCLIGDHVVIHDVVKLTKGVTVCPYKEVSESVHRARRLM